MSKTLMYTGYKKCHGMKFQGVVVPNGMIAHLAGLYCAPQNDARVLAESRLLKLMHEHMIQPGLVEGDCEGNTETRPLVYEDTPRQR